MPPHQRVPQFMQHHGAEYDGDQGAATPWIRACMRRLLGEGDESQQQQEGKIDSDFDPEDSARGNGQASHGSYVILYGQGFSCAERQLRRHGSFVRMLPAGTESAKGERMRPRARGLGGDANDAAPKGRKESMRVIAGKFRSRPLRALRGLDIRPTSDRLRETLFNVLTAGNPQALEGSVWLDLFAGTGAVGIEALSRGAAMVYFAESAKPAAEQIRRNLQTLDITNGVQIMQQESTRALAELRRQRINPDYIFLDPPYPLRDAYRQTLEILGDSVTYALVIAEHEKKFDPGEAFGNLQRIRKLLQGDAGLSFYRRTPSQNH